MDKPDAALRLFLKAVGLRLREARQRARLSLRDVGAELGCTHSAVGHWETATNPVDLSTLYRLAALYKTTVVALIAVDVTDQDLVEMMQLRLRGATAATPATAAPSPDLFGKRGLAAGK